MSSAIDDKTPASPTELKKAAHRRQSSTAGADSGVFSPSELEAQQVKLELSKEVTPLGWKINTSPMSTGQTDVLKQMLTKPPVSKMDLRFPLGMHVTARNRKGVTIKDALDAIHKAYKKKADDELDEPYLAGFVWDCEDSELGYGVMKIVLTKQGVPAGGKKKKGEKGGDA